MAADGPEGGSTQVGLVYPLVYAGALQVLVAEETWDRREVDAGASLVCQLGRLKWSSARLVNRRSDLCD